MAKTKTGGLAGIIAGQSAICTVGIQGVGLHYRGYAIEDLAAFASFEEAAYLLIYGKTPSLEELREYRQTLIQYRDLPGALKTILENLPVSAHPMDVLRTGCSALGTLEPETEKQDQVHVANRLLAAFPSMLVYWHVYHHTGKRITLKSEEESIAGYFLHLLHGRAPEELYRRALDVSLILYAEHEFNASTFAARVTASTGSDLYSAITSGIGTLRGSLHGGANEAAMALIQSFVTPLEAEQGVREMLKEKKLIMGCCEPDLRIV